MMSFFEQHASYVLIGREQYQVLLDDKDAPKQMWSTIRFSVGDCITIDGGKPRYQIFAVGKAGMGVNKHWLRVEE